MAQEFERKSTRSDLEMPPPMVFPEEGLHEEDVLDGVRERMATDPFEIERNFGISYVGPPHAISERAAELAKGTVFVEWAREMFPGPYRLEKEAVRMMASLFNAPSGVGFITSGGTESNVSALRLARDRASKRRPEVVVPETAHFSFRLGAEVLGLRLREVPVDDQSRPDMDAVRRTINRNTVALVCSAPEGNLGVLDPIGEFSDLAVETGLYLHVDAAFGGFILPFMRELGRPVPDFDFHLPGVTSIMTDGHKLGMLPVATSFLILRDASVARAIPTEQTHIHTLTSTKPGERAAVAWAVLRHLGRNGYRDLCRRVLDITGLVADGIEAIPGLRLITRPYITLVNFTSDELDVPSIYLELTRRGWGATLGLFHGTPHIRLSIHPNRDEPHARQFLDALAESVEAVAATPGGRTSAAPTAGRTSP